MVRVELPANLRLLANVGHEVQVYLATEATQQSLLDALEAEYPMLRGTVRDQVTKIRRPFIRFFACGHDLSHLSPDEPLPDAVVQGIEPFLIVGAIAGG